MRIDRNHIIGVLFTIASAVALVATLAWVSIKPVKDAGIINRKLLNSNIRIVDMVERPNDVGDFAGNTKDNIYFKTKDPNKTFVIDINLKTKKYVSINEINKINNASAYYLAIDSPDISIMAVNAKAIMLSSLNKSEEKAQIYPVELFTRAVKIAPYSFVLRGFDSTVKKDQIFLKRNLATGEIVRENNISEKRHDAGISTDGILHYDKKNNLIVYVYYYKSEFICLDTNLNLVYKGFTIDSTNRFIGEIKDYSVGDSTNTMITNAAPNKFVNLSSAVIDGLLFNCSKIWSKNESELGRVVVDVYEIKNNVYLGSFYIPPFKGEKMNKFKVIGNNLFVLYKSSIVKYFDYGSINRKLD